MQGLSGPAALKLSAFGARELSEGGYKGKLVVNWLGGSNANKVSRAWQELTKLSTQHSGEAGVLL